MSRIDDLIQQFCPTGVQFSDLGTVTTRCSTIRWMNNQGKSFKYIDLTSVDRTTKKIGVTVTVTSENAPSRAQQIVQVGDVVFATTRPTQMRLAVIPSDFDGQIASTGYCVLRPVGSVILTNFLGHLLSSNDFRKYVELHQVPGNYPSISDSMVRQYRVPVPPLEVQREIVRVLDLFQELEAELETELEARKKQYAFYRDSLLNFADSRERVRWLTLGEVGSFFGGLSGKSKSDFAGGNARYVSYMNVFSNIATKVDPAELVIIARDEKQNRLHHGDVLFTGSSETREECGMSSVITQEPPQPLYLNSFCIGFRADDQSLFDPEFSKHMFRSRQLRDQIVKTASGVTRFNVSKQRLSKVSIPVPDLKRQREIVEILDRFEMLVNDLSVGLPAELVARRRQYEFYRDRLLTFEEAA